MIGSILRFVFKQLSKRKLPIVDGDLTISGLSGKVEVIRDKWGVPHIKAENNHDLYFAQGFVQAQDRMWQMEQNRRAATGRLSEIIGNLALDTDRTALTFGFARSGKADIDLISEEMLEILKAYTEGVNAYLSHPKTKLPLEFTLLRFKPEPWTMEDSLAFSRLMMWQLSHAWHGEIIRSQIIDKVGEEKAKELEIVYPEKNPATLPNGIEFNILSADGSLMGIKGPFISKGKGSNSWAISGEKSVTGFPLLCNDMHLQLSLPSIWYENHLTSDLINVSGVTLPGVPLVQVGHNDYIAWGMTLAFTDAEDTYLEKINPENPNQYEFNGKWYEMEIISEEIPIKGGFSHLENIKLTRNGPIISTVLPGQNQALSIKSMALRPTQSFEGWLQLNKAINWDDFVVGIDMIDATQLNITYADINGNIGYYVCGKVPIRKKGLGNVPSPGWTDEYDWDGFVPFEEMPHVFNPERGFIITCNHKIIPDDFPYFLGNVWMNGYRARRFEEIINKKSKIGIEDCKEIQMDFVCIPGQEFKEFFVNYSHPNPEFQSAIDYLLSWKGNLSTDTIGGTIYEVLRYYMIRNILKPTLGDELTDSFMGKGFHPILYNAFEFYGHDTTTLLRILKNEESWWLSQAGGFDVIVEESLAQSISWLKKKCGKNPEQWKWGKLHTITFAHAMAIQKPLDKVFNRGPLPIGGDTDTLCQTAIAPDDPFEVKAWAPSHRQIIDLGNLSNSLIDHPPGQSGQLASKHYDDLMEPWLNGKHHPMVWSKEQIKKYKESILILRPSK